jgi:iron complex outermembrane receptor protein
MLWQPGNMFIDRDSKATAKSSAVFGQVVYTPEFLNKLHVTLGGRYTQDDKKGVLEKVRNIQANLPFEETSARFNPLAIASYEITNDINTYIKYATGYRSGGASSRSLTFRSFGPEDNISYEIGMKGDFFNRVRINAAAYTMERTGSQIDFSQVAYDPVTKSSRNTLETMNAPGITEIKGLEIDSTVAITENLSIKAAYTYTDTLVPATINPFKNQLQPVFIVFTPENVYNLSVDYTTYFDNFSVVAHMDANA